MILYTRKKTSVIRSYTIGVGIPQKILCCNRKRWKKYNT